MCAAESSASVITEAEARGLFADLVSEPVLVVAVSGGPDSTALLWLAARWRRGLSTGPKLIAVTVDHGLRDESRTEAAAVAKLARKLGVTHRTLHWTGRKPKTGVAQAARAARYRLLAEAAREAGATTVLTAHTLDDQAETVLIRLAAGSGFAGLAAMAAAGPLPGASANVTLRRPLLGVRKARLIATLDSAGVVYASDPTNDDPRFPRPRLRVSKAALAREGLSPERLARLADRVARAEAALRHATTEAEAILRRDGADSIVSFDAAGVARLPLEIGLRLLGGAIATVGTEGPVELGKLEALHAAWLAAAPDARFRRTLAGAVVTRRGSLVQVEPAPARRKPLTMG